MAKEKDRREQADLELSEKDAEKVTGGRLPIEGGGITSRSPAVHPRKHGHKSGPSAPAGGMPHE